MKLLTRWLTALALVGAPLLAQQDMAHMQMPATFNLPLGMPLSRLGSGTSWLPDDAPMAAAHRSVGSWTLMLHGAAFGQYDRQSSQQGSTQFGLTDWEMLMALRPAGGGVLRLDAMTSLQPLVDGARGYPQLLQTGGTVDGARLVNRQHPNELFMELAAEYEHSVTGSVATSLYVAAVGEPALGPVAYMHRPSGAEDPFAPLGHHWQDASHESFGVVTGGLYTRAVRIEGSVFNGRDPVGSHENLDYAGARLDSYAGRITVLPVASIALSAWGGYLYDHDRLEAPIGMQRYGASVLTSTRAFGGRSWSNAVVWGLNIHHHGSRDHNHEPGAVVSSYHLGSSVLIESSLDVTPRLSIYGRLEQVQKTADDLGFLGGDGLQRFNVRAASLGATRDVLGIGDAAFGIGANVTVDVLPPTLRLTYQSRTPTGFAIFGRVRPVTH